MTIRATQVVGLWIAAVGLCGCGESTDVAPGDRDVAIGRATDTASQLTVKTLTQVFPATLSVGEQGKVTCLAVDQSGQSSPVQSFTVAAEPAGIVSVQGTEITGLKTGQAVITCRVGNLPSEGVAVSVTGAKLVKLTLQGPDSPTVVGQAAMLTCVAEDASGQSTELGVEALKFSSPLDKVAGAVALTSKVAGSFAVTCVFAQADLTSNELQLQFKPGAAVSTETSIDPSSIKAGDPASQVTCRFLDQFGNVTSDDLALSIEASPEVQVIDDRVTSKKAGVHDVRCVAPPLKDSFAPLTVSPAAPDFSKVKLTATQVEAGASAQVQCLAFDAYGNATDVNPADWQLNVDPKCAVTGLSLSCNKSGDKQVRCDHSALNDAVASTLTVTPSTPVSLALALKPKLSNYSTGQVVTVVGVAVDSYGNQLDTPKLTELKMTPAGGEVDALNEQVSCQQDGLFTISAALAQAPSLKATTQLLCDSTGPLINVSSPKRASTRLHTATVPVKLSVVDELSPTKSTTLQGKAVLPASGFSINKSIGANHGLNVIKVSSKDKWDNTSTLSQSFYSSKAYVSAQSKSGAGAFVGNGLEAWLGQPVIDSGKRFHKNPKDIATVLEVILGGFDFKSLAGGSYPVSNFGFDFLISLKSISFGDAKQNSGYPEAKLLAKSGGMSLSAKFHKLNVKVYAAGQNFISPDLDVTVTASSMKVSANMFLSINSQGKTTVKTQSVSVKLEDVKVKIDNSWGWLVNWLINLFETTITNSIQNALEAQLASAVDVPLATAIDAFALNLDFDVPGFFGAPTTTVKLASKLSSAVFFGASSLSLGGVRLRMQSAMTSTKKVSHSVLGALRRRSCLKTYQTLAKLNYKQPMAVSLHFDALNQFMTALWQAEAFTFTVDEKAFPGLDLKAYGFDGVSGQIEMLLPPILNDCGSAGQLWLQAGDMRVKLTLNKGKEKLVMVAYLSVSAEVSAKVATDGIALNVGKFELLETHVDAVTIDKLPASQSSAAFFNQFAPVLASGVTSQLQGLLATIPLPEIDLTLLSSSLPKGSKLALSVKSVDHTPGHLMAVGSIK